MPPQRVIAAVWRESLDKPVVRNQVAGRAASLAGRGLETVIAVAGDEADEDEIQGVRVERARGRSLRSFTTLLRRLVRERAGERPVIVGRNSVATLAALAAARGSDAAVVFDVRGWARAEARDSGRGRAPQLALRAIESLAYRRADQVVVVSQALVGVALAYGASPDRLTLIPHQLGTAAPTRAEPELPAEVIHVGHSTDPYQGADLVEGLLRGMAGELSSHTFGWLDGAYAGSEPEWLLPNLWRQRVEPAELAPYLDHARVGIVVRPRDATNAVAVTTKATQYLAHGCSIVTSPYPPAVADLCLMTGAGEVVATRDPRDWARSVERALERRPPPVPQLADATLALWVEIIRRAARD